MAGTDLSVPSCQATYYSRRLRKIPWLLTLCASTGHAQNENLRGHVGFSVRDICLAVEMEEREWQCAEKSTKFGLEGKGSVKKNTCCSNLLCLHGFYDKHHDKQSPRSFPSRVV